MAADPTITGVQSPRIAYGGRPITPFAGVTITDPTPGAADTVYIGVFPLGFPLEDGAGFDGLMNQPFDTGTAHIGDFYMLTGTDSQVTAELDALVLTSTMTSDVPETAIDFGVTSSSGASSADGSIVVDNSSVAPNRQGVIDIGTNYERIFLQPFNIVFNDHHTDTTFVFSPGDEFAVIHGFGLRGRNHDVLELSGADFGNSVAEVLRNTGDVQGSAFITDPKTGDAIRLAGVTTAELKAHRRDISFV